MSLIHDALKSMDSPQAPAFARAHPPVAQARSGPAWRNAAIAFAVVLGAGILTWYWLQQSTESSRVHLVNSATQQPVMPWATTEVVVYTAAAVPAAAAPLALEVASLQPVQAMPSTAPAAGSELSATTALSAAPQETPRKAPATRPVRTKQSTPAAEKPKPVEEIPLELRFTNFSAAVKDARMDDAKRELEMLAARLPAGTLGLVRAQAWFDLQAGNDAAAANGYRSVIERIPGDEEAAINLASIHARQKNTEEARAILDTAARMRPDSAALRAALAQFTPMAR